MDPLVIVGGVRKGVHALLAHFQPVGVPEVGTGQSLQFIEAVHDRGHAMPPVARGGRSGSHPGPGATEAALAECSTFQGLVSTNNDSLLACPPVSETSALVT